MDDLDAQFAAFEAELEEIENKVDVADEETVEPPKKKAKLIEETVTSKPASKTEVKPPPPKTKKEIKVVKPKKAEPIVSVIASSAHVRPAKVSSMEEMYEDFSEIVGPVKATQSLAHQRALQDQERKYTYGTVINKENEKKYLRKAAGRTWVDKSLADWKDDDFRLFVGNLGNEVGDELLGNSFRKYKSFYRAKVTLNKVDKKSKGFGFVGFLEFQDCADALREMNGKYIGNRPCMLKKSSWKERDVKNVRRREKTEKKFRKRASKRNHLPF